MPFESVVSPVLLSGRSCAEKSGFSARNVSVHRSQTPVRTVVLLPVSTGESSRVPGTHSTHSTMARESGCFFVFFVGGVGRGHKLVLGTVDCDQTH